jgi:hypothetical protein
MKFSEGVFEAIIKSVDYKKGVCVISPLNSDPKSDISDVPLPYIAGAGNSAIFYGINKGTRVLASFTSGRSRQVTVILGFLPKEILYPDNYSIDSRPVDMPYGTVSYPSIKDGEIIMRGNYGSSISLKDTGDILFRGVNGGGLYLKKNQFRTSALLSAEDYTNYSNAGRVISGSVRRMNGAKARFYPKPDLTATPLFADPEYVVRTMPFGFFSANLPIRRSKNRQKRNPEISEYRMVINEFSTDYMFTGFDDEVKRYSSEKDFFENSETYARNRQPGNVLHLAEHELIEFVGGNLVDINGNILDLNYKKLYYGNNNATPVGNLNVEFDRARRISRRGIGAHFQLSTNTRSNDPSQTLTNFVFDIDKEGMLKLNIPASSDTGNIPFSSNANFVGIKDSVSVSSLNPSQTEPIPVTLRDEKGNIVFPEKGVSHRRTGLRYSINDEESYFPTSTESTQSAEVRVNTTKYHNMYATAERLIANTVKIVNIPQSFMGAGGVIEGLSVSKPFEVPAKDSKSFPSYMGTVAVAPGRPAIYHGGGGSENGGISIAGQFYRSDETNPPYSNSFTSTQVGSEIKVDIGNGTEARPVGGKSIHANLEGSIEASIGKDNWDGKSALLDTAGSIISWIGKDKNNRSVVMQTDGDFLLNVGGSYVGTDPDDRNMNIGRFELRVNVVDKKFVATEFSPLSTLEQGGNPGADSDYIISISEAGLVIAGMKKESPMIIRNDGPLLLESSSSTVTIKGTEIRTVDPKGLFKIISPSSL